MLFQAICRNILWEWFLFRVRGICDTEEKKSVFCQQGSNLLYRSLCLCEDSVFLQRTNSLLLRTWMHIHSYENKRLSLLNAPPLVPLKFNKRPRRLIRHLRYPNTPSVGTPSVENQTLISKIWNVLCIIFIWHISRCCGVPGFSTCI